MTSTIRRRRRASAVLAAALLVLSIASTATEPIRAPDVEMRDGQGRRIRLSDFRGKVVLVDLWASWCPPCERSFPALDALHREYRSQGLEVIAVNLDERRRDAEAFLKTRPHDMLVVFDPRARILKAFGASGVPSAYLIDRQGTVRYAHEGYTPQSLAEYRRQIEALLAEALPQA